ncbi:hypothetical protein PtrSN002B_012192 [Pyrenophora tritici-repentis]|nr:hypothetical protein PtrSN002B_012192 [Pyrenophora tritici-repentis]
MALPLPKLPAELRLKIAALTPSTTTLEEWVRMRDTGYWEAMGVSVEQAFTEWVAAQPAGRGFAEFAQSIKRGESAGSEDALKFVRDHVDA